jgi:D-lactate dehydrogenase
MRTAVFSTKPYDKQFLDAANQQAGHPHELIYLEPRLTADTARLAEGCDAVCAFVNDVLDPPCLERLHQAGVARIALRSAGFNHVHLDTAHRLGLRVARVPAYDPHGVAEHAVALMLTLNRHTHRAHNRIRERDFSLHGLLGFTMHGRTAGVVGTGKIGDAVARILLGFGCRVLAFDLHPADDLKAAGVTYVDLDTLMADSDIITLHCPLTEDTHHLIGPDRLAQVKPGVMIINTSRGKLVDTPAVIDALKDGRVGSLGLDVYEEEESIFFEDRADQILTDDTFARLLTFPNVLITGHQAFFTRNALEEIAATTIDNLSALATDQPCDNEIKPQG